jgi:hypothetical protein
VRCSRGDPCGRCVSRELQCDYPMARKRKASPSGEAPVEEDHVNSDASVTTQRGRVRSQLANTNAHPVGVTLPDATSQQPGQSFGNLGLPVLADRHAFPSSSMGIASQTGWLPVTDPSHPPPVIDLGTLEDAGEPTESHRFPPPATYEGQAIGLSSINWMSPEDQSMLDWAGQLAFFTSENAAIDIMGPLDLFGAQEQLQGSTNASTDGSRSSNGLRRHESWAVQRHTGPDDGEEHTSAPTEGTEDSTPSTSTERRFYVEGEGARAPFRGRATHGPSSVTVPAVGNDSHEPDNPNCWMSPETGAGISDDASSTNNLVSIKSYENLLHGLQAEAWQPSLGVGMGGFPSISLIRLFVQLYFEHFHPTLPFLRRGTPLCEKPQDWVLLLVVATMGTRYASGTQNVTIRKNLLGLSQTVLSRRFNGPIHDDHKLWAGDDLHCPLVDLPTLQAGVLHLISMLHEGTSFSVNQGLIERQRLVQACLSMDLFDPGGGAQDVNEPQPRDGLVRDWLVQQARIRTGLTIWVCSFLLFRYDHPRLTDIVQSCSTR